MARASIVHENFLRRVASFDLPPGKAPAPGLSNVEAVSLFRSQCLSRALDRTSRAMQKAGQGYYTIGSSGHEGMAAVAHALRPTDMAFLHYRDAAFQIARAAQVPGQTVAFDILLSFAASSEDPISGGRHKVLGSKALNIPPQTSTIASHLPKAVGAAYSVGAARRPPEHRALPEDAVVMCSFGDASANHSTAQGAFNTACWTSYQGIPLPSFIRLRGQRHWHFGQDPEGLDCCEPFATAGAQIFLRRRPRYLRHIQGSERSRALCSHLPQARLPSPSNGAPVWPCRRRYTDNLHEPGGAGSR